MDTVAIDESAPLWTSESAGQVLEKYAIVGNPTKPFPMLTICASTSGPRMGFTFHRAVHLHTLFSLSRLSLASLPGSGGVESGWSH
jgi:hypothetical protein